MKTSLNEKLFDLYSSKWANLCSEFKPILEDDEAIVSPTSPLFICVDEKNYEKSDLKVMFFGQETNGWIEKDNYYGGIDDNIKSFMDGYYDFWYNGRCWKHGGQFFNGVKRMQKMFEEKFFDKRIHYIWNNVIKIGKSEGIGRPPKFIYDIENNHFSVLREELKILKPDILIFFTGPYYDNVINEKLGNVEFIAIKPFSEKQLAEILIPEVKFAARTYHPNYLWRVGFDDYMSAMIGRIK